ATSISQMFRPLNIPGLLSFCGNRPSGKVDGSREAGPFKSFLLHCQSSSSPERASDWATRSHWNSKFTRYLASRSEPFKEFPCLSSVSLSECHGQQNAKPQLKRIKPTVFWVFLMSICRSSMVRVGRMLFVDSRRKSPHSAVSLLCCSSV